ncbi:lipopolysaccharide transport periplasmic protein LptA [Primorskyibacter sp. S187A]|uniref:lipopolysaccharide transport periplasmic protein LptA n=1 Tax=Primorskyibacter sp. S187A TaxID=3415130 RepID=UPI003C7A12AE
MRAFLISLFLLFSAGGLTAQEANVGFGTVQADPDAPVEVTAEQLNVSQENGDAIFTGNVVVGQGEMRLNAPKVRIIYDEQDGSVSRMEATGGVTLVSGAEAAEAERADYNVGSGIIVMTGSVLLTQGKNALTSDRMEVDLNDNTARMTGRVKTVLYQGDTTNEQQN